MQKQTKGSIFLLLCAMIWGSAFVAQSEGMQYVEPFTMGATRFFLAGLVLLPVIAVLDRKGWSQNRPSRIRIFRPWWRADRTAAETTPQTAKRRILRPPKTASSVPAS